MTETCDPPMSGHDDVDFLLSDLACVSGTLGEIATVWRRAQRYLPELPLRLPVQLQETAWQLTAAIQARTDAGSVHHTELAPSLPEQLATLKQSIAAAQAMTCGRGIPQVGDARLWESLNAALTRAASRAHLADGEDCGHAGLRVTGDRYQQAIRQSHAARGL